MATFIAFTDADGRAWKINPEHVVSITASKSGRNSIFLQDGTRLLSAVESLDATTTKFTA